MGSGVSGRRHYRRTSPPPLPRWAKCRRQWAWRSRSATRHSFACFFVHTRCQSKTCAPGRPDEARERHSRNSRQKFTHGTEKLSPADFAKPCCGVFPVSWHCTLIGSNCSPWSWRRGCSCSWLSAAARRRRRLHPWQGPLSRCPWRPCSGDPRSALTGSAEGVRKGGVVGVDENRTDVFRVEEGIEYIDRLGYHPCNYNARYT